MESGEGGKCVVRIGRIDGGSNPLSLGVFLSLET